MCYTVIKYNGHLRTQMSGVFYYSVIHGLGFLICFNFFFFFFEEQQQVILICFMIIRVKNNKTHFFYVLYSDKTWVFDQLECVQA